MNEDYIGILSTVMPWHCVVYVVMSQLSRRACTKYITDCKLLGESEQERVTAMNILLLEAIIIIPEGSRDRLLIQR